MHYLPRIFLKFVSSQSGNREPVGFEVACYFTVYNFQQNTREIMILLLIITRHIIWFRMKIKKKNEVKHLFLFNFFQLYIKHALLQVKTQPSPFTRFESKVNLKKIQSMKCTDLYKIVKYFTTLLLLI